MDDIVDSFIIEDELPEPRRRGSAQSSSSGGHGDSNTTSTGLPEADFFDRCSILIACNLPVHAGLWLGQYANLLAREEGPLAIIRLSGNTCDAEIFGDGVTLPTLPDAETGDALFDMTTWLSSSVRRVLIVPDPIDRDADLLASGLPIQLVSGTDSTAVVGTYQRAKGLCMARQNAHQPAPAMGLVMVGAEPAVGQKGAARIQNCASRFLDAELTLDAVVHRMDVMGTRQSLPIKRDSAYRIADLIASIRRCDTTTEETTSEVPTYIEGDVLQVIDREEYAELESVFDQVEDLSEITNESEPAIDEPAIEPMSDTLDPAAVAAGEVTNDMDHLDESLHPRDEFGVPTDLLSFLPDLRPIAIHHFENMIVPGVAFGVDSRQRLHLVAFGADVTSLTVAEHLISMKQNRSALSASLEKEGIGRLAPFSGDGLQRDVLLPEADASMAGLLHRGRYNLHLILSDESGSDMRCLKLD
ncbi:MAG: hypothetical protein CMJ33_03225 [Phycisphaerae bacterium]|nr:hypothetical protein [Phycisphaerae bacterium]